MRILMACGAPGKAEGGVAGIVLNLTKGLRDLGHDVIALARDGLPALHEEPGQHDDPRDL